MTVEVRRAGAASAALAAWCLFLGARYAVELGRSAGVVSILQPWWPDRLAVSGALMAAVIAATAAWLALPPLADGPRGLRWALAAAGAAAIVLLWAAQALSVFWHDALRVDAGRLVALMLSACALLPVARILPARVRAAASTLAPGWWAAGLAAVVIAFTTARGDAAAALAVNVPAWAFGTWLMRRLGAGAGSPALAAGVGWLLGWIVLGLLAMALGMAGLWRPAVAGGVLVVLAAVARRDLAALARRAFTPRAPGAALAAPERAVAAASAVLLAAALLASLAPEVYSDATGHHLALADRMAREGRLAFWPQWNATAQINHGAMLFAWPTLFATPVAGKVQNFLFAIAVPLLMLALARRWLTPAAGVWAVGIWCSAGLATWLSTTAYVDVVSAAYGLGAAAAFFAWLETGRARDALPAGLCVGALLATKFVSYSIAIPMGALVLGQAALRAEGGRARALASPLAFAAGAALVFLPWAARAWILTGNPIFPILNHVFRSPYWEAASAVGDFARMFGPPRGPGPLELPWAMAFQPQRMVEVGTVGPMLLALLPLALFARRWSRPLVTLLLLAALPTALWAADVPYLRWFVLYLPMWALAAGALLAALLQGAGRFRGVAAAAPFALLMVTVAVDAATRSWWLQGDSYTGLPFRVVFGGEEAAAYLRRSTTAYPAVEYLNRHARGERVLSPFFREHLYEDTLSEGGHASVLPIRRKRDAIMDAGDPELAWRLFREHGYAFLLVDGSDVRVNGPRSLRKNVYRREFLSRFARLEFARHAAYVFRIADTPAPDPQWPSPDSGPGNGGFEVRDRDGFPTVWLRQGSVVVDATGARAHGGKVAARVGGGAPPPAPDAGAALSTEIPLATAPLVMLTLRARSEGSVTHAWTDLQWWGAQGMVGSRQFAFWPGGEWEEFFFAEPVPAGASRARITIGARAPVWVDDVAFAPAPPGDPRSAPFASPALALYSPSEGRFYLRGANHAGGFDTIVEFGAPGDVPLMGDWDGDGRPTVGVYRPHERVFLLRDGNAPGAPDRRFALEADGDEPVAGDWDGDGITTVGLFRRADATFMLRNANTGGAPDATVACGSGGPALRAVAGDWDGDGRTTVGVFDPQANRFTLCHADGSRTTADFGGPADLPLSGDWDGDGDETIAVYRPRDGSLYARQTNTGGFADFVLAVGAGDFVPVPGSPRLGAR